MRPGSQRSPQWVASIQTAGALLVFLLVVYNLSYSGRFSTDDEHILASRSLSLAFQGRLNDDRVLGNERISAYLSFPQQQSTQALAIEPLQSLLGAGLARLSLLLGSGHVQSLYLLNIIVTALTAICVFASVRELGCPDRTALVTALLFGLGTQVLPYARTLFRDPLAMLFLAFAWLCALRLNRGGTGKSRWFAAAGVFFGLLLGILTKNTVLLAVPVIAFLLMPFWKQLGSERKLQFKSHCSWLVIVLLPLIVIAGVFVLLLASRGSLARFNIKYYIQVLVFFFSSPHPHFLQAVFGPLISPGKSLFLFSPLLALSVVALVQKRGEAIAAWVYTLLLIISQALFYDTLWWGSVNWGLRFLVPAIPLLAIASAPIIHAWLQSPAKWVWIILLGLISILIQLLGISTPVGDYYRYLASLSPQAAGSVGIWDLRYSALTWTAGQLFSGGQWDLSAFRNGLPGLLTAVGLVILGGLAWLRLHSRPVWIAPLLLGITCLAVIFLPKSYAADPVYYPARDDFQAAQADLRILSLPDDGLVIGSYATPAWYYWMNWGLPDPAWVSLPFSLPDSSGLPAPVETILDSVSRAHQRSWLLLPCDSPLSSTLLAQKDQLTSLELVTEKTYLDEGCQTNLLLFHSR